MDFPEHCIRGIPNKDFISDDGIIGSHLFHFKKEHNRQDGWCEQSINWNDDENAISFTLKQKKKDGEIQFKSGLLLLPRNEIDRLITRPAIANSLSYERDILDDNKYHGNLLLKNNVPTRLMKQIAAGLALIYSERIDNNNV
jgi:hypothetical protein